MRFSLRFKFNKNLDKKTCLDFLNLKYDGIDFGKGIITIHSKLKNIREIKSLTTRKKEISKYVELFYDSYKSTLSEALDFFKLVWGKVEQSFQQQVDLTFSNFPWPKGKYICYLSIFNCNPRFLTDKTFQVFYKNEKEFKRIIAHELLHFMFYDYLNKNIKIKISQNKKWIISEIFNTVILNQKDFEKIIKPAKELGYPEHKRYIKILENKWKKEKNITKWISQANQIVP